MGRETFLAALPQKRRGLFPNASREEVDLPTFFFFGAAVVVVVVEVLSGRVALSGLDSSSVSSSSSFGRRRGWRCAGELLCGGGA